MNHIVIAAVVFAFAGTHAYAKDAVIAKSVTSGGMPEPGETCHISSVEVFKSGRVAVSRCNVITKEVATLSADSVKALSGQIAEIKKDKLVPENPQAPQCEDAPNTSLVVIQNGAEIEIGGTRSCREMVPSQSAYESETVRNILKGLGSLGQI